MRNTYIKLQLGDIKGRWKLPQSYKDVSIKQGLEIESLTDKREILSVLTKCPLAYLKIIQDEQIDSIYDSLEYLKVFVPGTVCNNLRIRFRKFKRKVEEKIGNEFEEIRKSLPQNKRFHSKYQLVCDVENPRGKMFYITFF